MKIRNHRGGGGIRDGEEGREQTGEEQRKKEENKTKEQV